MKNDVDENYYTHTTKGGTGKNGGAHAEIYATNEILNDALKNGDELEVSDVLIYVLQTGMGKGKNGIPGLPMARCPHCEYITNGAKYFPETLWYGKNSGRIYGDYGK